MTTTTTTARLPPKLNIDCWTLVVEELDGDQYTLYQLLQVNKELFQVVVPVLYRDPFDADPSKKTPVTSFTPLERSHIGPTKRLISPWSRSRLEYTIARCSGYILHLEQPRYRDEKFPRPDWWPHDSQVQLLNITVNYFQFVRYMPVRPMRMFRMPSRVLTSKVNQQGTQRELDMLQAEISHVQHLNRVVENEEMQHLLDEVLRQRYTRQMSLQRRLNREKYPQLPKDRKAFPEHILFHGEKLSRVEVATRDFKVLLRYQIFLKHLTEIRFETPRSVQQWNQAAEFVRTHRELFGSKLQKIDVDGHECCFENFWTIQQCTDSRPKRLQLQVKGIEILDCLQIPMEELEWFKLQDLTRGGFGAVNIDEFLQKNRKLKSLTLTWSDKATLEWARDEYSARQSAAESGSSTSWTEELIQLKELFLYDSNHPTLLNGISGFRNSLEVLDMSGMLTDEEVVSWSFAMPRLRSLRLINRHFDTASLALSVNLTNLELTDWLPFAQPISPQLWQAPLGLKKLYISGNASLNLDLNSIGALSCLEHLTLTPLMDEEVPEKVPPQVDVTGWRLANLKSVFLEGMAAIRFQARLLTVASNLESFSTTGWGTDLDLSSFYRYSTTIGTIDAINTNQSPPSDLRQPHQSLKTMRILLWDVSEAARKEFYALFGIGGLFPNLLTLTLGLEFSTLPLAHLLMTEAESIKSASAMKLLDEFESLGLDPRSLEYTHTLRGIRFDYVHSPPKNEHDYRRMYSLESIMIQYTGLGGLSEKECEAMDFEAVDLPLLWRNRLEGGQVLLFVKGGWYMKRDSFRTRYLKLISQNMRAEATQPASLGMDDLTIE